MEKSWTQASGSREGKLDFVLDLFQREAFHNVWSAFCGGTAWIHHDMDPHLYTNWARVLLAKQQRSVPDMKYNVRRETLDKSGETSNNVTSFVERGGKSRLTPRKMAVRSEDGASSARLCMGLTLFAQQQRLQTFVVAGGIAMKSIHDERSSSRRLVDLE